MLSQFVMCYCNEDRRIWVIHHIHERPPQCHSQLRVLPSRYGRAQQFTPLIYSFHVFNVIRFSVSFPCRFSVYLLWINSVSCGDQTETIREERSSDCSSGFGQHKLSCFQSTMRHKHHILGFMQPTLLGLLPLLPLLLFSSLVVVSNKTWL